MVAALINLTERWHEAPTRARTLLLGLVAGLIVIVRHTNVLVLALLPLFVVAVDGPRAALRLVSARVRSCVLIAGGALLVVLPQLALYTQATGRPLVSSYGSLGFTFGSPHLYGVLISVQKGVFFWSPLLLLGVAGLFLLRGRLRAFVIPTCLVLIADTYLIASWWDWQFGASYGHRGFIDLFPLLALGLAAFFEWSAASRVRLVSTAIAVSAMTALSIFQMLQYLERHHARQRSHVVRLQGAVPQDLMSAKRVSWLAGVVVLLGMLGYLRDPAWLIGIESGFRPWERGADGTRSRWTGGHASFFVPSTAAWLGVPIRTTFAAGDSPVTVTVTVDDRPAASVELHDDRWRRLTLALAGPTTRRVRRIDIRVDRVRPGNRGVAIADVELR